MRFSRVKLSCTYTVLRCCEQDANSENLCESVNVRFTLGEYAELRGKINMTRERERERVGAGRGRDNKTFAEPVHRSFSTPFVHKVDVTIAVLTARQDECPGTAYITSVNHTLITVPTGEKNDTGLDG